MRTLDLDIVVTRGSIVESRHIVHAAVIAADGATLASAGNPDLVAHWRSCAKPLQVHPFVESGHFEAVGWGARELALACASHGGEPEHVELAAWMLASIGLTEHDLVCGGHAPLSDRGARLLRDQSRAPTRLHNNCSGKHAAMLASALRQGWTSAGYDLPSHPVQQQIRRLLGRWTGVEDGALDVATDGCGVPVFVLTLRQMALAYARLAQAASGEAPAGQIVDAMRTHPFLVGGTDRFDTMVMEETAGAVVAKLGAEGVHSVLLRERGIGFAVKVEDGHSRAQYPAVLRLLQHLDALPAALTPRLARVLVAPVYDTRGNVIGEVRPAA